MIKQKDGFTILEAVASMFLITLVLTTSMLIIINMRNQSVASERKINATDVGALIRNDLSNNYSYNEINDWLDGSDFTLTKANLNDSPISANIFQYTTGDQSFEDETTILFYYKPNSADYSILHLTIEIKYFNDRTALLEGAIYEKA